MKTINKKSRRTSRPTPFDPAIESSLVALADRLYEDRYTPSYTALAKSSGICVRTLKKRMRNTGELMMVFWLHLVQEEPELAFSLTVGALIHEERNAAMRPAARTFILKLDKLFQNGKLPWKARILWGEAFGTKGAKLEHLLDP